MCGVPVPFIKYSINQVCEFIFINPVLTNHQINIKQYQHRQGAWLQNGRPGFNPGWRNCGDFSSHVRVQSGPEFHSTSNKMSTGVKIAERRTSTSLFLVPWLRICGPFIHIPHRYLWPIMGILLTLSVFLNLYTAVYYAYTNTEKNNGH